MRSLMLSSIEASLSVFLLISPLRLAPNLVSSSVTPSIFPSRVIFRSVTCIDLTSYRSLETSYVSF